MLAGVRGTRLLEVARASIASREALYAYPSHREGYDRHTYQNDAVSVLKGL